MSPLSDRRSPTSAPSRRTRATPSGLDATASTLRTDALGELDGDVADAAARAEDHHRLALLEAKRVVEAPKRRDAVRAQRAGFSRARDRAAPARRHSREPRRTRRRSRLRIAYAYTRSPTLNRFTALPMATTVPAPSLPMIRGNFRLGPSSTSPARTSGSHTPIPAVSRRMSTSRRPWAAARAATSASAPRDHRTGRWRPPSSPAEWMCSSSTSSALPDDQSGHAAPDGQRMKKQGFRLTA